MLYLGYIWVVLVSLLKLYIIISIYGELSSGFEVIVTSILIVVYLSVNSFFLLWLHERAQEGNTPTDFLTTTKAVIFGESNWEFTFYVEAIFRVIAYGLVIIRLLSVI